MIELIIAVGIVTFTAGTYLGWWLKERAEQDHGHQRREMPYDDGRKLPPPFPIVHDVHVARIDQKQAEEILDIIFPNLAKHPYRHPEMEEEDDC